MAMIGVHMLLSATEPDALRAMLRDVVGWKHVGHAVATSSPR